MGRIFLQLTDTVGNTPLVRLNSLSRGCHATVLVKLEFSQPLGERQRPHRRGHDRWPPRPGGWSIPAP